METTARKTPQKERRPRTIQACNFCRTKKYKCDGALPCSNCKRLRKDCAFSTASDAGTANISIAYVKQLERKLEAAETQLLAFGYDPTSQPQAEIVASSGPARHTSSSVSPRSRGISELPKAPTNPSPRASLPRPQLEPLPEVMEINIATKRFEFHGTSSIITALDRIVQLQSDMITKSPSRDSMLTGHSICSVTEFQNDSFMPKAHKSLLLSMDFGGDEYYPMYAPVFIDAYFAGLHHLHPLIDQAFFIKRCNDLWNGDTSRLRASFRLQYYAVLALGAATRVWQEESIGGMNQLEWTQLLLSKSEQTMTEYEYQTDFEGAQALFVLAQVHLQFLSYNTAYTYLGGAVRIAHSGSCHRQMRQEDSQVPLDSPTSIISRVWWSLYSHEVELSFLLGRPDSVGDEAFITRQLPPVTQSSEVNLISALHGISKALREIAVKLYNGSTDLSSMLATASAIDAGLESSMAQATSYMQAFSGSTPPSSVPAFSGEEFWIPLQMSLIRIRYLHAKVALFYPFFLHREQQKQITPDEPFIVLAASSCIEASRKLIHETFKAYRTQTFQQTWSYYSAYMLRALAVILTTLTRSAGTFSHATQDRDAVIQALHVLDNLNNNAVPRRIANFVREYLTLLAKSGNMTMPVPFKNRYQGPPRPDVGASNFPKYGPPPPLPHEEFQHHLPFRQPRSQSYVHTAMNAFDIVESHSLEQGPIFAPSHMHSHPGTL